MSMAQIALAHNLPLEEVRHWSQDARWTLAVEAAAEYRDEFRVAAGAELARRRAARERRAERRVELLIQLEREARDQAWWLR